MILPAQGATAITIDVGVYSPLALKELMDPKNKTKTSIKNALNGLHNPINQ